MEAAPPNSRKRKRPSSSSFQTQGIFTRSRSELFVHRTRSGRGRPDRTHSSKLINQHLGSPSKDDQHPWLHPRPSIKDLRARRVFSPTTAVGECSPLKKRKVRDDPAGNSMPASSSDASTPQTMLSEGDSSGESKHDDSSTPQTVLSEGDTFGESQHDDASTPQTVLSEGDTFGESQHYDASTPQTVLSEGDTFGESQHDDASTPQTMLSEGNALGESQHDNASTPQTMLSEGDALGESQHDNASTPQTMLSEGDALGESQQTILGPPDSVGTDDVSEEEAEPDSKPYEQNASLICEEKSLESSSDENCGNRADPDADIEYALSDLSGVLYDLSGLLEFDGGGEFSSWADSSSKAFLQTSRTLDFGLFHVSPQEDDGSILVGQASSDPNCVLDSLPAVTEGFCHAKMDENIPATSSSVTSDAQNDEIPADPNDEAKSISPDSSREIEANRPNKGDCMDKECTQMTPDNDILCKSQLPVCVVTSTAQNNEIPADPNDKEKPILQDASREIEFTGAYKGDCMDEECIQTLPPDSDILCKSQLPDDEGISMVPGSVNPDRVADNMPDATPSYENTADGKEEFCQAKMDGSIPAKRRKGGLGSHSRLKLFQTPNSLSYRRLLPFLLDIAKDNESALEIHSCHDHGLANIAKTTDESAPAPPFDSLSKKTNADSWKDGHSSVKSCNDLMTTSMENAKEMNPNVISHKPCSVESQTLDSSLQSITEVPRQRAHECSTALCNDEAVIQVDPDDEMTPHIEQVKSESSYKLESRHNSLISSHDAEFPNTSPLCLSVNNDAEDGLLVRERKMELDRINDSSKECLKMEPPVGDRLCRDGGQDYDSVAQNHPENLSATTTTSESQSNVEGICPPKEENASAMNRPGLAPCSRLKLFQTPNSLAYKRLLPFLMDLEKENAGLLDNFSSQEFCEVELDKALVDRPSTLLLDSPYHDSGLGKQNAESLPLQQSNDLVTFQNEKKASHTTESSPSTSECSYLNCLEKPTTEIPMHNHPENVVSCDWLEEMLSVSCTESVLQLDQIMLENSYVEPGCEGLVSVHATEFPYNELSCSGITNEALSPTSEESGSDIRDSSGSCRESNEERERRLVKELAIDVKPLEIMDVPQHSSLVDKLVPAERLVLPPPKGILKKRPRDCKGLCTCQNCASFRLHTEQANEFMRKQMHEAEEVAMGLMKELSCLRSVMERSFSPEFDRIDGHTVVQIDQVRRLCRKALIAEELARNRLREMTQNLNNHCAITALQRQRVRFADHVEEKHIPKSETNG